MQAKKVLKYEENLIRYEDYFKTSNGIYEIILKIPLFKNFATSYVHYDIHY